jgi:hypothetical protein
VPKSNAVDAEAMCLFLLIGFESLLLPLLVTIEDLLIFEFASDKKFRMLEQPNLQYINFPLISYVTLTLHIEGVFGVRHKHMW